MRGKEETMTSGPWSWANTGPGNATPMACFYWLCALSEFELIVTNTMFKDERKSTWMHPRSGHWHTIDFLITRCRDKMDIHSTLAMRGANG